MLKRVRFFVSLVIFGLVAFCDWVKSTVKIKMGTIIDNSDGDKRDLDDSGCVQDGSPPPAMEPPLAVTLLDLSDDVLLYILRHCAPRDLKSLGYSCPRLGRLVRERSLWRYVDARAERCGEARLAWYVGNALHADTRHLAVRGYADESSGCLGMLNCSRRDAEEEQKAHQGKKNLEDCGRPPAQGNNAAAAYRRSFNFQRHHACLYVSGGSAPGLPRYRGMPLWAGGGRRAPGACRGPRFTASAPLLRALRERCGRLARLALERCNVDCNTITLSQLPPTLTSLSLRGARCYNLPIDKSFLFKIQDHLPLLESLDVSECEWLEPASLLPLSKHARLRELYMRDCHKLAEFVAYASLSSRYGFRNLQILDLRGSPVGDSEVAPLAWLPRLQELRLAAGARARRPPPPPPHAHYADDEADVVRELEPWEDQEPDYFKLSREGDDGKMDVDGSRDGPGDGGDSGDGDGDGGDDDDMNGGGSSAIRKPPAEQGECSKSKRDGATTKRRAEDGGGDAAVNGQRRRPKRKRNGNDSSSDDDSARDSEEEMYEKRRCQTIVIVDRRYISDNEDASWVRFARRYVGERNEERDERNDRPNDDGEAKSDAKDKTNEEDKQDKDEKDGEKTDDKDSGNSSKDTEAKKDNSKSKKTDDEVNKGASTSRGNGHNENVQNENARQDECDGERYVRFRQGEAPVIVDIAGRPDIPPERVVRFNSYNIRHEVIDNQQIYNVEIERCSMHGPHAENRQEQEQPSNGEPPAEGAQPAPAPQGVHANPPQDRQLPLAGFHQAFEAMQRQAMERIRLREQNPNIMNLIRGREPIDLPPPLAALPMLPGNLDENREPRHRVLYVNVGQPANSFGPLPNVIQGLVSDRENRILNLSRSHLEPSSLVTDASVRRFGRAAGNDIRFVLVGIPHPVLGPNNDGSTRPERSNLRVLVMNGYRNITDRSLIHLATAAPHLRLLDFRETSVTAEGVENFRSLRPDCEVLFSPYVERKTEWPDEEH